MAEQYDPVILAAANSGDVGKMLKAGLATPELQKRYGVIWNAARCSNCVEILEGLGVTVQVLKEEFAFAAAAQYGNMRMLHWLSEKRCATRADYEYRDNGKLKIDAVLFAMCGGHTQVLQWMKDVGLMRPGDKALLEPDLALKQMREAREKGKNPGLLQGWRWVDDNMT